MKNEELWKELSVTSREVETAMDSLRRKRTGSYYTDLELTDVMMEELVSNLLKKEKEIEENLFFEPCVGAGNFVFSYIDQLRKLELSTEKVKTAIYNIYVADINEEALEKYKVSLKKIVKSYWNIELDDSYFEVHTGNGLLVDVTASELSYISLEEVFGKDLAQRRFDIVVTNPPYKNLKAERNQYASDEEYEADKDKYGSISKIVSKTFKYSTDGVLNLYKLFVEEIIDRYANENALVSLLIPSSLMSDKTCEKLRTHILLDYDLKSIKLIKEGSKYIDAQQALAAILINTGEKTESINIIKDFCGDPKSFADVSVSDMINPNSGNAIIALDAVEYEKYKKLRQFPIVKDINFITNMRGELDLTAGKKYILQEETGYSLLRGRNIGYYQLVDSGEADYVSEDFINLTKKKCFIERDRIICQQIANMHKERRVTFAYAEPNTVLGNSCNFISVQENECGIDIYSLLGLFNTKIINWFFKLTSSNNHINNYEIDCFPVPVGSSELKDISQRVKEYLSTGNELLIDEIENLAEKAYGLNIV